jgi:hypothetical protein
MTLKSISHLPSVEMALLNIVRKYFFLDMVFLLKCALFLFMVAISVVTESFSNCNRNEQRSFVVSNVSKKYKFYFWFTMT